MNPMTSGQRPGRKAQKIDDAAKAAWQAAEAKEKSAPDVGESPLPTPDIGESVQVGDPDLGESPVEPASGSQKAPALTLVLQEEKMKPVQAYKNVKSTGDKWTYILLDTGKYMVSRPDGASGNKSFEVTDPEVIKKIQGLIASGDLAKE